MTVSPAVPGAVGACCFFANWSPEAVRDIIAASMAGEFEEAQRLQVGSFGGRTAGNAVDCRGYALLPHVAVHAVSSCTGDPPFGRGLHCQEDGVSTS